MLNEIKPFKKALCGIQTCYDMVQIHMYFVDTEGIPKEQYHCEVDHSVTMIAGYLLTLEASFVLCKHEGLYWIKLDE